MRERKVYLYMPQPNDTNLIGSRYHYQIKMDSQGCSTCFKVRNIAQGFGQKPGIDYGEVYAPVASMPTIKTGLALIAKEKLEAFTIDVKTAYLYASLDKSRRAQYMEQLPGGTILNKNGNLAVCELDKGIYGLPDMAAAWYSQLKDYLNTIDIQSMEGDTCNFVGSLRGEHIVLILIVCVDNSIIGASKAG